MLTSEVLFIKVQFYECSTGDVCVRCCGHGRCSLARKECSLVWREQIAYVCFFPCTLWCFYLVMDKMSIFTRWWGLLLYAFLEWSHAVISTYKRKFSSYILKLPPVCGCVVLQSHQVWFADGEWEALGILCVLSKQVKEEQAENSGWGGEG